MGGWFKLESWLFMPKDLMRTIWLPEDTSVQPYFIVNFSPTSVPDFNVNTHICPSGLQTGFTKDDIKTCLINYWGASEDRATAFADSWEPLIREGYATGKPFPGLTEAFVNLGVSGNILFDGFWLFWVVLVLLIIAIVRKKYHKLLPFLLVPVTIYGSIILFAPLAYERYTFPIFFCVPFLIAIFIAEKSRRSKSA
jgi:hypothetical protein